MWCVSKKFHPSWGVAGTEVHPGTEEYKKSQIGKGWEWYAYSPIFHLTGSSVLILYCQVAFCVLAISLGMDRSPLHPLEGSWYQ